MNKSSTHTFNWYVKSINTSIMMLTLWIVKWLNIADLCQVSNLVNVYSTLKTWLLESHDIPPTKAMKVLLGLLRYIDMEFSIKLAFDLVAI